MNFPLRTVPLVLVQEESHLLMIIVLFNIVSGHTYSFFAIYCNRFVFIDFHIRPLILFNQTPPVTWFG